MALLTKPAKLAIAGGALAAAAAVSMLGLNQALRHEAGVAILWLGWLSAGLIVGSAICLMLSIARFFPVTKQSAARSVAEDPELYERDYLAKYSVGDKIVACGLATFWASLTAFFIVRSADSVAIAISLASVAFGGYYLAHIALTQVLFTKSGFVVWRPFRGEFSERYSDVKRVQGKLGSVHVEFADGHILKLHRGMGDRQVVLGFLLHYCADRLEDPGALRLL